MKRLMIAACLLASVSCALAFPRHSYTLPKTKSYGPSFHRGYVTKTGAYVAPHMQTAPNATKTDNWSSRPNVNPYTGKPGKVDPYRQSYGHK